MNKVWTDPGTIGAMFPNPSDMQVQTPLQLVIHQLVEDFSVTVLPLHEASRNKTLGSSTALSFKLKKEIK